VSQTVLVVCRECAGTGNARGGILQCEYCLGQCHIAVNRMPDGGVPDGEKEWKVRDLGPIPRNPLILSSDAPKA
jgi:DnaJ-class molecular chaperone